MAVPAVRPCLRDQRHITSDIYTLSDAISTAFGHNLFWLIVLSGMVLGVLEDTGIIRRVAISIITCKLSRKGPWFFVTLLIS